MPQENLHIRSEPVQIFADYHGSDTNFAPLILSNGSQPSPRNPRDESAIERGRTHCGSYYYGTIW